MREGSEGGEERGSQSTVKKTKVSYRVVQTLCSKRPTDDILRIVYTYTEVTKVRITPAVA